MGILSNLCSSLTKSIVKNRLSKYANSGSSNVSNNEAQSVVNNTPFGDIEFLNENAKDFLTSNGILQSTRESVGLEQIFDIANWGYKDFINERINWQKGIDSLFGEPAWYYFKIFFKFDTQYGLLGGVLNELGSIDSKTGYLNVNTAEKYLKTLQGNYHNSSDKVANRRYALQRFVRSLSWISSTTPWFFHKIRDVNNGSIMNFENLTEQKSLEIECLEDATDMRLMTLMDLYKYAAYDEIRQKEILPDNLRKFDMDVVVFQSPLRYFHTSTKDLKNRKTNYKSLNASDFGDRMSFKLFTFQNCEIDYNSLSTFIPSEMSNESAFSIKSAFRINYERVYQHLNNEFVQFFVGDGGIYSTGSGGNSSSDQIKLKTNNTTNTNNSTNKSSSKNDDTIDGGTLSEVNVTGTNGILNNSSKTQEKRLSSLIYANENKRYYNSASSVYKSIVDATEDTVTNAMRLISPKTILGNMYGNYGPYSDYGKSKIKKQKNGLNKIDYSSVDSSSVAGALTDTIKSIGSGYTNWWKKTIEPYKNLNKVWSGDKKQNYSGNLNDSIFSRLDSKPTQYKGYSGTLNTLSKEAMAKKVGDKRTMFEYNHEMFNGGTKGNTPKRHVEHHNI